MVITKGVVLVLLILWTITLLVLYHKVFEVFYFDLLNGFLKELIVAGICGALLTYVTLRFWWIVAIIVVVVGIAVSKKLASKVPTVIGIILAILFAISGICFGSTLEDSDNNAEKAQVQMVSRLEI